MEFKLRQSRFKDLKVVDDYLKDTDDSSDQLVNLLATGEITSPLIFG